MSYEFQRPEDEWAGGYQEKPKAPVRFSPRIKAAIEGKPLVDYSKDRVFLDEVRTGNPSPKKAKKPKMVKEAPLAAQEAGKAPEGIQSTKNYKQFKLLATNRPVDQRHVNKLVAAIRTKNLLNLNPIVVNGKFEVIDGQHRLEAAKRLGIAIFYAQDEQVSQDDIAGMNSNKKNWGLPDYIHFYAAQGSEAYVRFVAFCAEHPDLQMATLLGLCAKDGNVKRNYKDGVLDISSMPVAVKTLQYLPDFKTHTPHYQTTHFLQALGFIVRTGLYDHEHMIAKLEKNPGILLPSVSARGWIESLEKVYNRHMRDENIVIFLKRR